MDKEELVKFVVNLENIGEATNRELLSIYDCNLKMSEESIDKLIEPKQ